MKLTFNINYRTNWGESLYVVGSIPQLGNNDESEAVKMDITGSDIWQKTIKISDETRTLFYRFIVKSEDGRTKNEWGKPHTLNIGNNINALTVFDRWQDQPFNKHYYSSAFTDGIFRRNKKDDLIPLEAGEILISIATPNVQPDEYVAISGNTKELGEWTIDKSIPLSDAAFPIWQINIPLKKDTRFEYKFVILKKKNKDVVVWENGDNRVFDFSGMKAKEALAITGLNFRIPRPNWHGAGVAIPVFSLRSNDDFGVGDFYDLYKMIDWAVETGQNIVQILPINDTTMTHTWTDSYPYNANSTFALHPMYLRVDAIGELKDFEKKAKFEALRSELNSLDEIDYERVNNAKNEYLKELFAEKSETLLKQKDFKAFVENNKHWLIDYAAFCVLRDEFNTPDFSQWGSYSIYDKKLIDKISEDKKSEINFILFQQYYLDKQLTEVRNYANKKGVVLKGDIPIGISRTSADAWVNPKLFNMDCQAGAPPDDFSVLGQNWGFPTYNWEEMEKDGFAWWKDRFRKMAEYFDAYRIDHILGFFRIWQIPLTAVHGLLGTFNPAMPFSADELRYQYDFWLDKDLHTNPFIMDYFLYDFFGEYTDEVKAKFLTHKGYGRYGMKEAFNNQKKVADYFSELESNTKNTKIMNALMGLIDQVLFIEDSTEKDHYHPRISAQFTYVYRSLNDYEKWCFDRLYNDFFYHRHNDFWYGKAMQKLPPLINATDMLVCGEDLGMIPDCVSAVMDSQQILSLEIQRMPKDPKAEFGFTSAYPYLSVATTSTHDMSGIRAWWEEDREKTQHFFNNMLHESGNAPYYAEPWICDKIVANHLNSPAMLTILPLQDWLSIDGKLRRKNPQEEQINVPANSRHYWRYRMHLTLEELINQKDFNNILKHKIINSGR